jgi:protein-S-isoprenylcysteine O-methyltransferase Ste14
MITGVFLMLICELLVFGSWGLFAWLGLFVVGNLVYIPRFEEPVLARRFGEDYLAYKRGVPRWVPRLRAWQQERQ